MFNVYVKVKLCRVLIKFVLFPPLVEEEWSATIVEEEWSTNQGEFPLIEVYPSFQF